MEFDPYVYRQAELLSEHGDLVLQVPLATYIKSFDADKKYSITYANRCVGGAVMVENRFHIAVLPEFRGVVGRELIRAVEWGLSICNPFIATVHKNNKDVLRLVEFFNRTLVGQDASTLTFLIKPRGKLNVENNSTIVRVSS